MWNLHRLTIYDHVLFGNFRDLVISRNNTEQINTDNVENKNGTLNEYMDTYKKTGKASHHTVNRPVVN